MDDVTRLLNLSHYCHDSDHDFVKGKGFLRQIEGDNIKFTLNCSMTLIILESIDGLVQFDFFFL